MLDWTRWAVDGTDERNDDEVINISGTSAVDQRRRVGELLNEADQEIHGELVISSVTREKATLLLELANARLRYSEQLEFHQPVDDD